jgi:hypothetical protein
LLAPLPLFAQHLANHFALDQTLKKKDFAKSHANKFIFVGGILKHTPLAQL